MHHAAKFLADFFDFVAVHALAHGVEARCAGLVFEDPVAGKRAVLDVFENLFHVGLGFGIDHARAGDVFAIFGRVRDRVVHVGDAAFINKVNNQFGLVKAFEIGHFRRVASLDQGFIASLDQLDDAATEHSLFAEEVCFGLFAE